MQLDIRKGGHPVDRVKDGNKYKLVKAQGRAWRTAEEGIRKQVLEIIQEAARWPMEQPSTLLQSDTVFEKWL